MHFTQVLSFLLYNQLSPGSQSLPLSFYTLLIRGLNSIVLLPLLHLVPLILLLLLLIEAISIKAMTILDLSAIKKKQVPNPEHYRRRRQQLEKDIVQRRHAISTKNNIYYIKSRWRRQYPIQSLTLGRG